MTTFIEIGSGYGADIAEWQNNLCLPYPLSEINRYVNNFELSGVLPLAATRKDHETVAARISATLSLVQYTLAHWMVKDLENIGADVEDAPVEVPDYRTDDWKRANSSMISELRIVASGALVKASWNTFWEWTQFALPGYAHSAEEMGRFTELVNFGLSTFESYQIDDERKLEEIYKKLREAQAKHLAYIAALPENAEEK